MKTAILFLTVVWSGCWRVAQADLGKLFDEPSSSWSETDCLAVLFGAQNNNLLDHRTNIKVIALPYYPQVVKALGRRVQRERKWSEDRYQTYVDGLLKQGCGFYIDWAHPGEHVYDAQLQPLSVPTQVDSLLFHVRVDNIGWPPVDLPMLAEKIHLLNQQGDTLSPKYITRQGRESAAGTFITFFLLFNLRKDSLHFLENSDIYSLIIEDRYHRIILDYPVDRVVVASLHAH